jgi:hypothetical protein
MPFGTAALLPSPDGHDLNEERSQCVGARLTGSVSRTLRKLETVRPVIPKQWWIWTIHIL